MGMPVSTSPLRAVSAMQRHSIHAVIFLGGLLPAVCLLFVISVPAAALSLSEAEVLALQTDPAIAAKQAQSQAMRESSVAKGQLPDPRMNLGVFNVPLDSMELDEQPTTQLRFGLKQAFPRGDTLRYKQKQGEWEAVAQDARALDAEYTTRRKVRETFLDLYYQDRAGHIIADTRDLFAQLVKITEAHYASGKVSQQDVLRAQLELSRLDDRATEIQTAEDTGRAMLAKWIGDEAWQPIDAEFPDLPLLMTEYEIRAGLPGHPSMAVVSAKVMAGQQSVQIAREQYKPGWSAGLEYRKRFGDEPDGSDREDMMAAMVTMDLPLFREKRQDRDLAASQQQVKAASFNRDDRLRELQRMLRHDYATWDRLGERHELYRSRLLREADANAKASIKAYQSGVIEFTTLMRARITELDVRLKDLRIRIDKAKAQARLLYLAVGEEQ